MSDAKLRRLRDKMLDCDRHWRANETNNPTDAAYWRGRIWVAEYVVQRIDSLLAEPESGSPWREDERDDPNWGRVCICGKAVRSGERFLHAACVGPAPPRESLAEEVARLHGFVGPDGRGRP